MAGLNLFTNNAASTLASSINSSVTSLTVASGQGTLFPNPTAGQYFYCTLSNTAGTIIEIVKVTARSTDTFTIVRGQDNTSASSFSAGDKVELRLTAADLQNFPQLDSTNTFATTQTFTAAPVFTDATGTRSAMSAAKSGANSDITSITGLTTALTVAQGGTGVTTSTGTGAGVHATSPTLTTPILGTPTSVTLTNATGLPLSTGVTGTLPVANGGTGVASATAYALLAGGTTSTGAHQSLASVGTSGQVLTSNGAGALPTWQTAGGGGGLIGSTVYTSGTNTFTIPTGVTKIKVTILGGGGGSRVYGGGAGTGGTTSISSGTQTITTFSATGGSAGNSAITFSANGSCSGALLTTSYLSANYGLGAYTPTCAPQAYGYLYYTLNAPTIGMYNGTFYGAGAGPIDQGGAYVTGGGGSGGGGIQYITGLTAGLTLTATVGAGGSAGGGGSAGTNGIIIIEY